jgi:hypothetical protein
VFSHESSLLLMRSDLSKHCTAKQEQETAFGGRLRNLERMPFS